VLREIISWPISMARTAIELPRSMERSIREANDLMEVSREQLEVMRRQADEALEQAERMNELLARVVRLTEPLERAQRGGEYVAEGLKRAIFGPEEAARASIDAEVVAEERALAEEPTLVEEPALGEEPALAEEEKSSAGQEGTSALPPDPSER
jgi:division protein CdvB (Snf7/Vps24/ESCRT-III family)